MMKIFQDFINFFPHHPISDMFISIGFGHIIGKIKFGRFRVGGVIGTLVCAIIVGQFGAPLDPEMKKFLFYIFIYAVGYESGPQFFNSVGKHAVKDILLVVFITVTSLVTVLICARVFHMSKGLAAGVAAGGLTQSAIIGTAGSAISQLNLSFTESNILMQSMTNSFAITYVIGVITSVFLSIL